MNNFLKFISLYLESIHFWIAVYILFLTASHGVLLTKKWIRLWKTRHIRKVWGIKNKERVIVVCSELDDPDKRQNVEPREYIYNLKYGDVDAYFEVVPTLLRLYPDIKLRIMSSGEAENARIDLSPHLILIGGPDYNAITESIIDTEKTQFKYRSPYLEEKPKSHPEEIVIYDKIKNKEYCRLTEMNDYGYLERIKNLNDPTNNIILIGGCHTIGVTGAAKAFSMADSEQGEIPKIVLENAKKIAKKISSKSEFSVLFSVERIGQTINIPTVDESHITIKRRRELWFFNDRFGLYSFLIISAISILIFYLLIKD